MEFVSHYYFERNHQGKGNLLLFPEQRQTRDSKKCQMHAKTQWVAEVLHQGRMNILTIRPEPTIFETRMSRTQIRPAFRKGKLLILSEFRTKPVTVPDRSLLKCTTPPRPAK